jgi:hypothetical protein
MSILIFLSHLKPNVPKGFSERLFATHPTPKLENHPFSAIWDHSFFIFVVQGYGLWDEVPFSLVDSCQHFRGTS